jgi:hypothetical protein
MPTLADTKKTTAPARTKYSGVLRCMGYKQANNLYVAECIDLNLMVKAKSMKKAVESLNEAIHGYLLVACNGNTDGLVPRPSPFDRRLVYHWMGIKSRLAGILLQNRSTRTESRRFEYADCGA